MPAKFSVEPKSEFLSKVREHYSQLAKNHIDDDVLEAVIQAVTNHLHLQYQRFWKQYPKSRKRYSKLKTEDIKHPFVHHLITDFLLELNVPAYREYAKILLEKNEEELDEYELSKKAYFEK